MWITCKILFIEQDRSVKEYLAVDRATAVTKNEFVNFEHVFVSWAQDKIHKTT